MSSTSHEAPMDPARLTAPAPRLELDADQAALFVAASDVDASLYYACRFRAGDPIVYLQHRGRAILLVKELELGRARAEAAVDEVVSLLPIEERLRTASGRRPQLTETLAAFLRERGVGRLVVPASFAIGHADQLRARGFAVEPREEPFFPERAIKTAGEIRAIAAAQQAACQAVELAIEMIRKSRVRGDTLELHDRPLTAEAVRREVHRFLFDQDYLPENTIVAGGDQACDPHVRGSGVLPAHRPIVLDIFPRSLQSRYWGDVTRTVLRGNASAELRALYRDVLDAHDLALSLVRHGINGKEIHGAVVELFRTRGRVTEERDGTMVGFFHSLGHGVGLDIHEYPKVGATDCTLAAGHAITIEPGLYYVGLGGVRIEDLVVVTETGHTNLTPCPCEFVVG